MLNPNLLAGKLVQLVAINPETTAPLWSKWRNNSEYLRLADMDPATLISTHNTREWIEKHLEDWLLYEFEIRTIAENRTIGSVGLDYRTSVHGDTFVGIGIGEPEFWGKGYGTEAMQLILHYAFMELNLHRVSLDVFGYNQRAIHSYEKAGFKLEGQQRGVLLREGQRWDLIYMGILREEFFSHSPPS
ncbi:MAG: GNAT family protein [Chloroflexota bacterium]